NESSLSQLQNGGEDFSLHIHCVSFPVQVFYAFRISFKLGILEAVVFKLIYTFEPIPTFE
ncbi:MAG: hypothetical protein NWF11_03425, partial [Candidatus Bathyarchaeota archaeon]|nr:hypothetical protein [Candidatus Bathyarchaeota archaeon]